MAHVLILEPDRLLAGSLKAYFANGNHTVAVHGDPQQAVLAADSRRPALVISELQLAGRSGAEFLYEFRSYPDWQAIPIIVYTNLRPEQVSVYADVLAELEIAACLHKSQTGLAQLRQTAERFLPAHASR